MPPPLQVPSQLCTGNADRNASDGSPLTDLLLSNNNLTGIFGGCMWGGGM